MNAIIFDFDGTLADSFDVVTTFLARKAHRGLMSDQKQQFRGLAMKDMALQMGIPSWRLPLVYFQGKAEMAKHMHKMGPFAGMPEVLAELKRQGYQLYIISSNNRRNIDRFLTQQGLGGYFNTVYGNAGWFDKSKMLKKVLRQNNIQPQAAVYVGDEVRDLIAAHGAGVPSVAVNWGFSNEADLLKHNPTIIVRSPAELQKVLVDWGKTS